MPVSASRNAVGAANRPLHPHPHPAPGPREPILGISARSRRAHHTRPHGRAVHGLGDPPTGKHRPSTRASFHHLGRLPAPQADALLACDFIETVTLNGQRHYILAVIEHATRRIRVLGTTAHPTAAWVAQTNSGFVFTDEICRPLHPQQVSDQFSQLAFQVGLPPVRLHELRHGAASLMLAAGVDQKVVQETLGHVSSTFTRDTYTSVYPEVARAAAESTAALVNTASGGAQTARLITMPDQPGTTTT